MNTKHALLVPALGASCAGAIDATAIQQAADRLAADAVKSRLAMLVPWPPAAGDDACAKRFIATFGRRLFRRPLGADEQAALEGLYATARTRIGYDFTQAPMRAGKLVPPTPFELASRLSFLLWTSTPDDELLAAAEGGKLATPDDVLAQARRLLASPRARAAVDDFFTRWLDLDRVGKVAKDAVFKEWTPQSRAGALAETTRFAEAVVFEGDGTVKTLAAPFSFINQPLAAVRRGRDGHRRCSRSISTRPSARACSRRRASWPRRRARPRRRRSSAAARC